MFHKFYLRDVKPSIAKSQSKQYWRHQRQNESHIEIENFNPTENLRNKDLPRPCKGILHLKITSWRCKLLIFIRVERKFSKLGFND